MVDFSALEYTAIVLLSIIAIYLLTRFCGFVYIYFIGPVINKVNFKAKGRWALVTGCTDGIGKEYARQLAAQSCDIVLVSRSMAKLKDTAEEIEREFKVATKIIQVDFNDDESIYNKIKNAISGLEIGTLVNNVGVTYPYPEYFLDVAEWEETMSKIFKANMVSVTQMTRLVLPEMRKRGKGVIINVGSLSAVLPQPLFAVYAASKAYVKKFTEDIETEYRGDGIIFQCAMAGVVATKMSGVNKISLTSPTPETYVKAALSLVGTATITSGYLPHSMLAYGANLLSKINSSLVTKFTLDYMNEMKEREKKKYKNQ